MAEKFLAESQQWITGLLMLPLMGIMLIAQIKRWHDRDKSGWWVFINLIPCVGGVWTLIECGFLPGTPGENRFGRIHCNSRRRPLVEEAKIRAAGGGCGCEQPQ